MEKINLPLYSFKQKTENGQQLIFDEIRKKYVALTPEEWVRQTMIKFLICERNYPLGRIAVETSLSFNGLKKRCDCVVYDQNSSPLLVVEFKAPNVSITQKVFDQISVYNMKLNVKYMLVSNGVEHYFFSSDSQTKKFSFLNRIPFYEELIG
ncbi:MAG: type I restriction enzyme HsdR N-terminal domain-containing protein [Paludibacteraceae bacterium]|nr:type I restriction enzyme HsdR N-terminal domain-containing protein [Paludibacteraceae bacterium]